ncbi:MAG: UvrD-helicase domain-containing protein [Arenicella sp.]
MTHPSDSQQRQQALDISQSWIVQAPAGSGKTAILVYRTLALLTTVEQPEQVLAITFTRKAAKEMRDRLLELLNAAEQSYSTDDIFEQQGLVLASQVLQRDQELGWQLLDMPHRLNVQTIDALSAKLVASMPWLSRLGDRPNTSDNPQAHFQYAVEQLLSELLDDEADQDAPLARLLFSLDNNYRKTSRLLATMLGKRDQWLRHFIRQDVAESRFTLEMAWQSISHQALQELVDTVPVGLKANIVELATFSANTLAAGKSTGLKALSAYVDNGREQPRFPRADFADIPQWLALQHLLLTGGQLRKPRGITVKQGFAAKSAEKDQMLELLAALENEPEFLAKLAQVQQIPPPSFSDQQWQQLLSLNAVLKKLLAHLQLRFHASNECDFSEVAQRANLALEDLGQPTDLALRLDYQIQHILVDEFQDTSHAQFSLLENLTKGWQLDDGRTLFLVGDPMQSIYRFREADVGLFLRAARHRKVINEVELQPLVLSENFRSSQTLVDWFNSVFSGAFPKANDETSGAIVYSQASSHKNVAEEPLCVALQTREQEAAMTVDLVQQALQRGDESVAILVRSRGQLKTILPELEHRGITYAGVDIKPLNQAQEVLDVLALCKALVRLDDKVAWLSLLRGPWCGLSLAEITQLTQGNDALVWQRLQTPAFVRALPTEAQQRLQRLVKVMEQALHQRQLTSLSQIVKWAWQRLGGEQTLLSIGLADLDVVWRLIDRLEVAGDIEKLSELEEGLNGLYAQAASDLQQRVVVSTIHKSKGLQYETVILPGLSRKGSGDDKDILRWAEAVDEERQQLLLAPLDSSDGDNSHYKYLQRLESLRDEHEQLRLLYVACTRAEKRLYLLADFKENKSGEIKPDGKSLLARVWSQLEEQFVYSADNAADNESGDLNKGMDVDLDQTLRRLPLNFRVPVRSAIDWQVQNVVQQLSSVESETSQAELDFEWATSVAQAVGIVLHNWLQYHSGSLSDQVIDDAQLKRWRAEFMAMQVEPERIEAAVKRMRQGIVNMQQDPRAQWLFRVHSEQKNEYALSEIDDNGVVKTYRIDRTFIDNNVRWIIDYKSTVHFDDDVEQFVDEQVTGRHKEQLDQYARVMSKIEQRPIKLGVYFPLLMQWREWDFAR